MSILDSIIDATQGGARVISEQNNTSAINWARGLSDPGEMLGCGMYQELRRQAVESDSAYQARLEGMTMPDGLLERIKTAALSRASLGTANGKISAAFALKPAWHGLGTVLDRAMSSTEALRFAGMDWAVNKVQNHYYLPTGEVRDSDGSFGIVRADTGDYLGTVGSRYTPVQNVQGFDFLDGVLKEHGATYESAGAIFGGKSVWMLAHMPAQTFNVNGDTIEPYCLFANCHDGSGAAWCYPTSVRVECSNTFRTSGKDKGKGLSIRHTGNVKDKIRSAQTALGLAVKGFEEFRQQSETLVRKPANVNHYANDVLDACLDITAAQALQGADALAATVAVSQASRDLAAKSFSRKIAQRESILEEILERYDSGRCHPQGTAWAAFNAVTETADHGKLGKESRDESTRLSRRFESVISGERDEIKQVALAKALAL